MRHRPSFEEFAALAAGASLVPVYRQLVGDTLTPVTAFCMLQEGDWSFLFESVVGGERLGRYSFLGSGPFLKFQAFDRRVVLQEPGKPTAEFEHPDPLRLLEEKLAACRAPQVPGLPRFSGGAVGYAGYDAVRYVERLQTLQRLVDLDEIGRAILGHHQRLVERRLVEPAAPLLAVLGLRVVE